MSPEAWLDRLRASLPATDRLALTAGERDALLELARVAAHTSERWTAPVSTYLAGVALAEATAEERAAALRSLVDELHAVR